MSNLENVPIAITMGDACGIGPEIIAKMYANDQGLPPTLVLGDEGCIRRAVKLLGLSLAVKGINSPEEFRYMHRKQFMSSP
jgi:4-hydroxythreonine-4-phosphate dehydrogenase